MFRRVSIRQLLIVRPGDEVRSVREAIREGYRLGGEARSVDWEDSFYCPICGFRTDDLDVFRTEQEAEVEGMEEQAMTVEAGSGEVEVEEPDAPEAPPEEPEATAVSRKGWVTLDDFLGQTAQGGDARAVIETADGAEAPSAEGGEGAAEQEQAQAADQPHAAPEAGREPQSSGEQVEVHQLFTRRESEDMRAIRRTLEWWAEKYWFTLIDVREMRSSIVKAVATVGTERMPLFLFMLEELHHELRQMGFTVLLVKPIGENRAEIHIGYTGAGPE
ncbi:MAG: hypothetical protein QXE23_02650 [Nitrososphaerota archaeon]